MKLIIALITAILLLGFQYSDNSKQSNITSDGKLNLFCPDPPSFTETVKTVSNGKASDEIDQDWYSKAMEQIEKDEYNISYNEELGAYQSPNRANNIRFIYHKDGFTAKTRMNKIPKFDVNDKTIKEEDKKYETIDEFEIDMRITNDELQITNNSLQAAGNKAWIENEKIRIDYTNTKEGMRQDFIIKNKPEGEGKLRLKLTADTKLKMIVGADALMFKDDKGQDKMKYSSLKVWDANGRELRAYFEKNNYELGIKNYELKTKNNDPKSKDKKIPNSQFVIPNSFSIVVNDQDAAYPITIDPLSASPNWTAESNQVDANFGVSVSTAGDVNGDGFSDVIVGANLFDNGQTNEGRAYVYHGSASGLSATANWTAESNQADANFGYGVSTAGDVNGDGYSDVIVGAYWYDNGQTNEGRAFVYHGSASGLSATANWTAESDGAGSDFGTSVSTAGDVNGDGFSDVIVGAPYFSNDQAYEGRAFVYHGSATGLSVTANWTAESNQEDFPYFGWSVSTAGDVNNDGYDDVIVGASGFSNGQTDEGRAFVYYGSASGLSATANWTAESNQADANFGYGVSTAGDVNGDGYSDVIVGAYRFDNGQTNEGRAFVYRGSASGLSATANWTAESNQAGANFGISVSTAGDVNGDGYSDVIVGAYWYDNGQTNEGRAFVYHGSASGLSATANWTAESNQADANFGCSVSTAGDVNGDGYSDVIVGARTYANGQASEGRAFVYLGSFGGLPLAANWTAESDQANANFGCSVSTAGDVNGDGYSDVIIGANLFDNGQPDEGRAFVYHGSDSGLSLTANWTAESNQPAAFFGWSVSTAGDVNGDGYSDVIVGAYRFDNGQTDEGRAFVYYGSFGGLSPTPIWTAESNQANAWFGSSVSTAGDVNSDNFSDVIVGANLFDNGQTNEGRAYVYHGSASGLSATANWTAESDQASAEFGCSVSKAGDVNGDGYDDVIVGASQFDNGQADEGRAFVYHGSSSGLLPAANWTAESNQANALFGFSVSTTGNVNGDGYDDVIVGAYNFDNGQTDEGRAYVYHGSSSGLSLTSNWTAESNQTSAQFGYGVSTAGDVNGDGYSDVIVGANQFDNAETDEGRIYIYYGSSSGLPLTAIWTAESNQASALFGNSVSTAGDINGDGYSDVIVGSRGFDNGQVNEGRAFVYYGEGPPLISVINLNIRSLLQGHYQSPSQSDNIGGDTVRVYLRNGSSPYAIVDSAKAYVNEDIIGLGQGDFIFSNAVNGTPYYIVLRHRNSIETWSKTPQQFTASGLSYDFSIARTQAYGDNLTEVDVSIFGVYSGDVNQDGTVDATDVSMIDNDAANFVSGYVVTDLTGDNFVDGTDFAIADNNAANFVSVIRP